AMLAAYAQNGHLSKAEEIFAAMEEASLVSWTAMLDGYARNGFVRNAASIFHSMPERNFVACDGLHPDESSFVSILLACSRSGHVDAARRCFSCLSSDFFVVPSKKLHSCVIDTLCRAAFRRDASELVFSMPFKPDSV
ncbi:hypothetical protein SELMODRAFT_71936, partial [Selaginella moellendorffii]